MSFDALAWAAKQKPGNLAAKMVLLALANYADEHGCAYPSTAAIAEFGDMNHKTATVALDRLEALGLIIDSGKRAGRSGQIKVYRLNLQSLPKTEPSQNREPPVFSEQDPQKRVTDTVTDTSSEPKGSSDTPRKPKGKVEKFDYVPPEWVPDEPWQAFVEMRTQIRAKLTNYAARCIVKDLEGLRGDGHDPGAVLDQSTKRCWRGVFQIDQPKPKSNEATPLGSLMAQASRYKREAA